MAKRRVPAVLHHELSEYASLLRALRVRDALDTTKHLTKPSPFTLHESDLNSNDSDAESCMAVDGPSDLNHPANAQPLTKGAKAKGKQKATLPAPAPKQRRRDHWTRWPVLLNDVPLPEWTLEDEVAVIASQVIKSRPPLEFPVPSWTEQQAEDSDSDDSDRAIYVRDMDVDSDDPDHPYYTPYLTSIITDYLSTMLGIIASHTPARAASMQNRIEPLNWRAVIDVVVSCGVPEFSNAKVVENVIKRMEAIYGPSILPLEGEKATSFRAVERILAKKSATEKFEEATRKYSPLHSLPYFRSPSPMPLPKPKLAKKDKEDEADYKARTTSKAKDPSTKRSKAKGKGKQAAKNTRDAAPTPDSTASGDGPDDGDNQPLRRSKRARTSVSHLRG